MTPIRVGISHYRAAKLRPKDRWHCRKSIPAHRTERLYTADVLHSHRSSLLISPENTSKKSLSLLVMVRLPGFQI